MIFINEWLPNPAGDDAKGEFIELFNNGAGAVNLNGWRLGIGGKKDFPLDGYSIAGNGYLLLSRAKTKLTLRNSDASLSLYDPTGKLADQSAFIGTAPSGQSFSRINYATDPSQHFVFADPTPGAANNIVTNNQIAHNDYPMNTPLNSSSFGIGSVIMIAAFLSLALAGIMVYALKQDENLSQLFFGKDQGIW